MPYEQLPEKQRSVGRTIVLFAGAAIATVVGTAWAWLLISGSFAAINAWQLKNAIDEAKSAASSGQIDSIAAQLPQMQSKARTFAALTTGGPWWLIERSPVGSKLEAVHAIATSIDEITTASEPLQPLLQEAGDGTLRRDDGTIDLQALKGSADTLVATASALRSTAARLDAIPQSDIPGPLAGSIDQAVAQLPDAANLLDKAAKAARVLPGMFGADGDRIWAVLLENTAESRGTGGLIGSYALMRFSQGKPTLVEANARKTGLDGTTIPTDGIAQDAIDLWGSDLTQWATYNLSPDFPMTAQLTVNGMKARETPVTAVAAFDAQFVAAILAGTGPVTAKGVTIDSTNAADYFTKQIYIDFPDPVRKDEITMALVTETLNAATSRRLDLGALVSAMRSPVSQGSLLMWSQAPVEENWLASLPVGGVLKPGPRQYAVALNNGAGGKLDAYVNASVSLTTGQCADLVDQNDTFSLTLTNTATADLPDYVTTRLDVPDPVRGSTRMVTNIYAPDGATLWASTLDGQDVPVSQLMENGRLVWGFDIELMPGQARTLTLTVSEPASPKDEATVVIRPMTNPTPINISMDRTCPVS